MSEQFVSRTAGASRHVGVVILNYNTIEDTRSCLDELLHTDAPNRSILVLDNGSRENEGARLHIEYGDKILVARSPINLGFAKGCNVASATLFHREKLSSLLFLNSDARIGWRDVMTLEEFMLSQPRIAAVGPRIVYGDSTPQTAGGRVDYVRGEPHWYPAPLSDLPYNVQVLHGAALLVNADAWNRIGPFDPDYFVYSEETDWCVRAAAQGWKLFCVPGCVAYHGARGSFRGKLTPLHVYYWARNRILFVRKRAAKRHYLVFFAYLLAYTGRYLVEFELGRERMKTMALLVGVRDGLRWWFHHPLAFASDGGVGETEAGQIHQFHDRGPEKGEGGCRRRA